MKMLVHISPASVRSNLEAVSLYHKIGTMHIFASQDPSLIHLVLIELSSTPNRTNCLR